MKGYVYITGGGYEPSKGTCLNDPHFEGVQSLGACMPNVRRQVEPGDGIYAVSGKTKVMRQFVLGGFTVEEVIPSALTAYLRYPGQRLRRLANGQIAGNIIITATGQQHPLDHHPSRTFNDRIKNYVVGRDPIALTTSEEVAMARRETLPVLTQVLGREGDTALSVIGRWTKLDEFQVQYIRDWLEDLKDTAIRPPEARRNELRSKPPPCARFRFTSHRPTRHKGGP